VSLLSFAWCFWPGDLRAQEGQNVAILEFRAEETFSPDEVQVLSEKLRGGLLAVLEGGPGQLLSAEQLAASADEAGVYLEDCDQDLQCQVEVAGELGVDFLLSVAVVRFGKVLVVTFKLYEVETGKVLASREEEAAQEIVLFRSLGKWAGAVVSGVLAPGPATRSSRRSRPPAQAQVQSQVYEDAEQAEWEDEAEEEEEEVAAAPEPEPAPVPVKAAPAVAPSKRLAQRTAQIYITWSPGGYAFDSKPCIEGGEDCAAPSDSELRYYDFLKTTGRAPILGGIGIAVELFPGQEYLGFRAGFTRLSYSTDFEASSGGSGHCSTHFCDEMSLFNIDFQARLPLLKRRGPLDVLGRIGYQFQDLVIFRRLFNPNNDGPDLEPDACPVDDPVRIDCTSPVFETIGLHGMRLGFGLRYTVIPQLRPHLAYDLSLGIAASLGNSSFEVPGPTSHHFAVGVSIFPWKPLLFDISYDFTSRSLNLSFFNEQEVLQRGEVKDSMHTLRLSAGLAF